MPGSFRPLTAREDAAWAMYEHVHGPIGVERLEVYLAQLAYAVVAPWVKDGQRIDPSSFLVEWDRGPLVEDARDPADRDMALRHIRELNASLGGVDTRPGARQV